MYIMYGSFSVKEVSNTSLEGNPFLGGQTEETTARDMQAQRQEQQKTHQKEARKDEHTLPASWLFTPILQKGTLSTDGQ